ncbi:phosphate ABC transporter substrate-binding protein [Negativibacillus massiliensis]|uniref:phosphate ABC transporter substrate-binding protein n=1 Tax=Negativibacillus massiliensis TaxID=1871035 RepID=UPI002A7F5BAA|nr:phosphate ABC transporter substrate-binding protein [Negativibacillus massiliensis]MDY4048089.1 phosphate ABC transporter substrate-binding protein [Negativibacillus massiliensis]
MNIIYRRLFAAILAGVMVMSMAACGGSESGTAESTETAQTEETKEEEPAEETSELSGSVSTNGSTSMEKVIGILSEQFMAENPGVSVTYDPTGSGTGIEAASNGSADIGLSSRALKDEEASAGLEGTTVALDGIAIIVNAENPVEDMSVEQIAQLFTGAADWSLVGGEGEVACIGREAGSGTRDGFESITGTEDTCVLSQELTSTGAVIEAVKSNPAAIGYASLSAVEGQEGIKMVTVDGVACSEETVQDGTYKIQRPFVMVTNSANELSEPAQAFMDFALSDEADDLIRDAGAVPMAE